MSTKFIELLTNFNIVLSGVLILAILLLREFLLRRVKADSELSSEEKRRTLVRIRNSALPLILFALFLVWASEIKSFAISILAVAAAIVIATKELLMCLSGYFVRSYTRAFCIGDRIEVGGIRGDVIDLNFLTTTLIEIGPGQLNHQNTGRTVVIPNSIFVTSAVINETFTGQYVLHTFCVPLSLSDDWLSIEKQLIGAAQQECSSFIEEAQKRMDSVSLKESLEVPSVEPRVTLQLPEPGKINLLVRIPSPARRKGKIEQAILRRVFHKAV